MFVHNVQANCRHRSSAHNNNWIPWLVTSLTQRQHVDTRTCYTDDGIQLKLSAEDAVTLGDV